MNQDPLSITWQVYDGADTGVLIVTIPGVFADEKQYSPIRQTLLRHGNEFAVSYREDIDTTRVPADIAMSARDVFGTGSYHKMIIVGTSLGGMVAVETANALVRLGTDKSQIALVIADALVNDADGVNPVETVMSKIIMRTPRKLDPVAKKLLNRFLVPPHPDNVEPYNPSADYAWMGGNVDETNHYERLVDYALTSMRRASFRRHAQQLQYICRMDEERLGIAALEGLRTIYICCSGPQNITIKQPQTANRYRKYAPHIKVHDVEGTHVGYAEQSAKWRAVYEDVLTQLLDGRVKSR